MWVIALRLCKADESNFTSNFYSRVYGLRRVIQLNIVMSRVVFVGLRPHYVIVPILNTQHTTDPWRDHNSRVLAISSTLVFCQAEC